MEAFFRDATMRRREHGSGWPDEWVELLRAVGAFIRTRREPRSGLNYTEVLEIMKVLGWRKVARFGEYRMYEVFYEPQKRASQAEEPEARRD